VSTVLLAPTAAETAPMPSSRSAPAGGLEELIPAPLRPHQPVMADEVVRLLAPAPGQTVVDCTFGAGGHAARLAPALGPTGLYVAIDRDPTVREHVEALARSVECRMRFLRSNMADALPELVAEGLRADAVLMDLGLSSMQVDRPERGFSYSRQAPLDMRMDPDQPRSAADLVAEADEKELAGIFRVLGEERHAGAIARAIVRRRETAPLLTTADLVEVIRSALPTPALFAGGHPAKRVFQALRIAVNDELASLGTGIGAAFDLLPAGGRMAVLAFHSLEDRLVKRFIQERTRGCICPPELPVCGCGRVPRASSLTPRALRPGREELDRNPRARSARLRALTRTGAR
jgi:16S rRNA (cytosine1402-N4)-methyltransferase